MNIEINLSAKQQQKISQAQIQSLQLLALDNFELARMMEKEYLDNPLLEQQEGGHLSASGNRGSEAAEQQKRELPAHENADWLEEMVLSQLTLTKYSNKELEVIRYLTGSLDENGFFLSSIGEAAAAMQVTEAVVKRLLCDLKKLEPYGIFAGNLEECLLLQLDAAADQDGFKRLLIEEYLEALGQGKISTVSRALHVPTASVREALWEISRLNPRPLNGYYGGVTSYVIPDILIEYDEEKQCFQAKLNDSWCPDYQVSDYYYSMMKKSQDPELSAYFEKKYHRAKFLLAGIAQRRETILAVADYIGKIQHLFLLGKANKKPVTMTAAAKELGIAVSTVSRAVKGKYIQYPAGSILFKELFAAGILQEEEAGVKTRDDIKEQIKSLIEGEDQEHPMSDLELVKQLAKRGVAISRRTVTKYRDSMGIKGCFDRRRR